MYKTVRHGENSLQYTILPQNDDFRMDSKLSSAESSCSSATMGRKPKCKRQRRRSFFAYLGLLFICTVIIGAILIPFLVSAECLPNPTEWFIKSKAAFMRHNNKQFELKNNNKTHSSMNSTISATNSLVSHENVGKQVQIINKDGMQKIILRVNKTNNSNNNSSNLENDTTNMNNIVITTSDAHQLAANSMNIENNNKHANYIIDNEQHMQNVSTVIVTTVRSTNNENNSSKILQAAAPPLPAQFAMQQQQHQQQQQQQQQYLPLSTTIVNSPHAPPTVQQQQIQQVQQIGTPTMMTRIIQVPLLKSTAKKPILPPVLVKSKSNQELATNLNQHQQHEIAIATEASIIVKSNKNNDWLHTHWPLIDPSTYFQWTGFKVEDSVLLPAILGIALIGVILIIAVCLLARNKRSFVSLVKKRKRHDVEEPGAEDNATLLTATNLSDED